MPRLLVAFAILVGLTGAPRAQELHVWGEELSPIFSALGEGKFSGFLELTGQGDYPSHLPSVPYFPTPAITSGSPLQNLRKIVAGVREMQVSESNGGTFLIRQKGVAPDILEIRISHLAFEDRCFHDVYSANRALMIILQAPEVVAYATTHNIAVGPPWGGGGIGRGSGCGLPPFGTPHFSSSMDNVTVAQAIERVFQAFPGEILVYWNFPKERGKKGSSGRREQARQTFPSFYSECHQTALADLPDPFCLPPAAFSAFPVWLSVEPPPQPAQRKVFFWFFSRKQFGNKILITSG